MSLDADAVQWDKMASRFYDNRPIAKPKTDSVNSPTHYTHGGGIECIDAIDAMLGREGSLRYYEGSMLKYLWRWRHKGGVESLRKCRWFLERIIETEVGG
jgi:hypothetical protein